MTHGFRVTEDRYHNTKIMLSRGYSSIANGCTGVATYVDGALVSRDGEYPLDAMPYHMIEAIEVYRGAAGIPAKFNGTGSVWRRPRVDANRVVMLLSAASAKVRAVPAYYRLSPALSARASSSNLLMTSRLNGRGGSGERVGS